MIDRGLTQMEVIRRMKGTVSGYADDMDIGVIIGEDGKRFVFSAKDWTDGAIAPNAGLKVTFEPARGCAQHISVLPIQPPE